MSESQFYLWMFKVLYQYRLPLKDIFVDWGQSPKDGVTLYFQKTPYIFIDADHSTLPQYKVWFDNVSKVATRQSFKKP